LVTADANGVIDPDVIWSCTNCGACVHECPVDIEHIDHIDDMRRYQVLIESAFPIEAAGMLKNLENKGDPWGMGDQRRAEWISELDFEVPVVDGKVPDGTEYLFWVGCAGALEDRARKTTKAIATLLHTAGVKFAVLGPAETCTGDPARRMGNEFVFSMLAQQNVETLNEAGARTIVASCPHCFNALANEYPQLGGNYQVITTPSCCPGWSPRGSSPRSPRSTRRSPITIPASSAGTTRCSPRRGRSWSRCRGHGAGDAPLQGARVLLRGGRRPMWMEERIGKRINIERIEEALGTGPDTISTACPYCLVMLGDAISAKKSSGEASESLEIVDVATLLARSAVPAAPPAAPGGSAAPAPGSSAAPAPSASVATDGSAAPDGAVPADGPAPPGPAAPPAAEPDWARLTGHGQPTGRGVQRRGVRGGDHGPGL
jgi:ferredoxin